MKPSAILVSTEKGITSLTLNRPDKCNAMDDSLIREFIQVLDEYAKDKKTNSLLITAKGNHFCAGADVHLMQKMAKSTHEENIADAKQLAILLKKLYLFPKPTIALLQGFTLGGGLGLTACCDIAIAAENTVFGFSEAKLGLTPSVISPYVIAAMGERATRYYFLTAQRFGVEEAHRLGLIHQVVPLDSLWNSGLTLVQEMLENSPNALMESKKLIQRVVTEKNPDTLFDFTVEHLAMMRKTKDAEEGLAAFLEKRSPIWT